MLKTNELNPRPQIHRIGIWVSGYLCLLDGLIIVVTLGCFVPTFQIKWLNFWFNKEDQWNHRVEHQNKT